MPAPHRTKEVVESWKQRAMQLKLETYAFYLAYRDSRTSRYARMFAACVVGYVFSPIDLIPDTIPVLGYLDDLVLVPPGISIALRMIPPPVMAQCREKAPTALEQGRPINWAAAVIIVAIWLLLATLTIALVARALVPDRLLWMNYFQPVMPLDMWTGRAVFGLTLAAMVLVPTTTNPSMDCPVGETVSPPRRHLAVAQPLPLPRSAFAAGYDCQGQHHGQQHDPHVPFHHFIS